VSCDERQKRGDEAVSEEFCFMYQDCVETLAAVSCDGKPRRLVEALEDLTAIYKE